MKNCIWLRPETVAQFRAGWILRQSNVPLWRPLCAYQRFTGSQLLRTGQGTHRTSPEYPRPIVDIWDVETSGWRRILTFGVVTPLIAFTWLALAPSEYSFLQTVARSLPGQIRFQRSTYSAHAPLDVALSTALSRTSASYSARRTGASPSHDRASRESNLRRIVIPRFSMMHRD